MSEQDKERVEEELRMHIAYDWFLDDNPDVQERVEKGAERGKEEGKLEGLRRSALKIVEKRFPSLADLAQQQIVAIAKVDELEQMIDQLIMVSNEAEVRKLLKLPLA
jgi:hypothetical protein